MHGFADTPHQHGDVCALPAPVGVQLIEHQEIEVVRHAEQPVSFVGTCQQEFEHHVVRQEDVRWIGQDAFAFIVVLLARVALVTDDTVLAEEFLELLDLTIRQRVHGVDDDRLNARQTIIAEHIVDDGNDVCQRLTRAGSRRQNI